MKKTKANYLRTLTMLAGAVVLSTLIMPTALAQSRLDFTLTNQTGYEIREVYVSPNNRNDWEEDVLGQDTLADGASVEIKFSRQKQALWDLKVVFTNGRDAVWTKFDLSRITDIVISFNCTPYATTKNGDN